MVIAPFIFKSVLPISIIGSTANIGPTSSKYGANPVPDKTDEATVCPPPGIPAIPNELIVTTKTDIK